MNMDGFVELEGLLGPGVYALFWKEELMYIGKAKQLLNRLYAHRNLLERSRRGPLPSTGPYSRDRVIRFNRIFIRPCMTNELDMMEQTLIKALRPKRNIMHMPPKMVTISELNIGGVIIPFGPAQMEQAKPERIRRI